MGKKRVFVLLAVLLILGGVTAYIYRPEPAPEYAAFAAAPQKHATSQEVRQRLEESRQKYRQREAQDEDKRTGPEDKIFAEWYAGKAHWKQVPQFVSEVYVDGSGKPWYSADGSDRLFHQTVENAAAGKTTLIRGAHILLVDRAGRFWAMNRGGGNILHCYDGKTWTQERFAVGGAVVPSTMPADVYGRFVDAAFEDSAGNLFFVGGWRDKTGSRYGIHTRRPDGTWNYTLFPPLHGYEHTLDRQLSFMELPGKRVVLYPRFPQSDIPSADCRIYYFNGSAWSEMNPTICKDPDHRVEAVVPLADGSICTLCSGARFWSFWPEPKSSEKLETLVVNLSDPDAKVREAAASALLARGPQIYDQLVKLSDQARIPESQNRLKIVLETLSVISKQDHSIAGLQGGRFRFDYPYVTAQTRDGGVRLHVSNCIDSRDGKKYEEVYLTISPTGQWDLQEIPQVEWYMAGIQHVPTRGFEDSLGGLWVGNGLRTTPSFSLAPVVPEGFEIDMPAFEDGAHRLYFSQSYRRFVFDPAVAEDKSDLPRQPFRGAGLMHLPGEASAWGVNDDNTPHVLFEITPQGEMKRIADNMNNAYVSLMLPLKHGFIVDYNPQDDSKPFNEQPSLWDGSKWTKAETLDELIQSNAAKLVFLAGTRFVRQGRVDAWLAGDGKRLWYYLHGMKDKPGNGEIVLQQEFRRYSFFDGEKWRNVHAELNFDENDNVSMRGVVQGGRSIVVVAGPQVRHISFDGKNLVQKEILTLKPPTAEVRNGVRLMPGAPGMAIDAIVDGPGDEIWFRSGMNNKVVYSWKDGQLKEHGYNARPQMCDSKGRMWFTTDQSAFVTKVGEQWISSTPKLVRGFNCMAEGPDGRIWVVHLDGLSELTIDGPPEKPAIRELGRWSLGGPKNSVREVHIDQANGLWFFGGARRIVRFQLPQ